MNSNSSYNESLFEGSKKGRNNSFIELSFYYLPKVFSLVIGLVPINEEAIKISSEALLIAWRKIKTIQNSDLLEELIIKVAILKCLDFLSKNRVELLDDDAIANLSDRIKSQFSDVEEEILKLSAEERVVIILCDKYRVSVQWVERICKSIKKEDILDTLNNVRHILIKKFPSENFPPFSDAQWEEIDSNLKMTEQDDVHMLNDNQAELVNEYLNCSKELVKNLFKNLKPDEEIIENLRNIILKEDIEKIAKKKNSVIKEDIIETEILLNNGQKKENPGSVVKKSVSPSEKFSFNKRTFQKAAITIGIALIVVIALFIIYNKPESWKVSNETTRAIINGTNTTNKELIEGDVITTAEGKRTKIECGKITSIEILENSEFEIIKITGSENVFELKSGTIKFNSAIGLEDVYEEGEINYTISSPYAKISTKNSNFLYSINEWKGFEISIKTGWLNLDILGYNYEVYCGNNYYLNYEHTYKLVVPYYKNSSEDFITAVKQISDSPSEGIAFNYIINNADEFDALTLWYLLYTADFQKRKLILEKIDEILLLDVTEESGDGVSLSDEIKQDLLNYIKSDLLIRNDI